MRRDHMLGAARTGVLHLDMTQHPYLGRYDIELLTGALAQLTQSGAVVRAQSLGFGPFVADLDAFEVAGQCPLTALRWCRARR